MCQFMIVCASLFLSLYTPYAVCLLLVSHYRQHAKRVGLGPLDSLVCVAHRTYIVRGAKFVAGIRKTMSGIMLLLFISGVVAYLLGGTGAMLLFWFIELAVVALFIDVVSRQRKHCSLG